MGQSLYEGPTVISSRCYAWMHSTGQLFQYEQPRHGFQYLWHQRDARPDNECRSAFNQQESISSQMGRGLAQYWFSHQHFQSRSSLWSLSCHLWQRQGDKEVKFQCFGNNLYIYIPPQLKKNSEGILCQAQFISTLEENKTFYTKHQFEWARRACQLLHSLRNPLINDLKAIIWMNSIKNNPVTTEYIEITEKIFGPNIPSLKGKTTRRKPVLVVEDYINIPKELVSAQRSMGCHWWEQSGDLVGPWVKWVESQFGSWDWGFSTPLQNTCC